MLKKNYFFAALAILLASCNPSNNISEKPLVMVSIMPQKYCVERIADTLVRVEVLVPPGSSPETYEPTASQLRSVSSALVLFSLGLLDFEKSLVRSIERQNPNLLVINLSKGLSLLEGMCHGHHHGHNHSHSHGFDPHVWSSPTEVKHMVRAIEKVLSEKLPDHSEIFAKNAEVFIKDLESLDSYIQSSFVDVKTRKFFLFHPALTYYARDYNLIQVALEEDGKAPSMKHFKSVINTAKEQGVKTIFIQKEFDVKTAKTAADDIGGRVEVIDPLDENWLENMYTITDLLKEAMNGN